MNGAVAALMMMVFSAPRTTSMTLNFGSLSDPETGMLKSILPLESFSSAIARRSGILLALAPGSGSPKVS